MCSFQRSIEKGILLGTTWNNIYVLMLFSIHGIEAMLKFHPQAVDQTTYVANFIKRKILYIMSFMTFLTLIYVLYPSSRKNTREVVE